MTSTGELLVLCAGQDPALTIQPNTVQKMTESGAADTEESLKIGSYMRSLLAQYERLRSVKYKSIINTPLSFRYFFRIYIEMYSKTVSLCAAGAAGQRRRGCPSGPWW